MIIRATTATNDWQFGRGLNSYFINEAAVEANIRTKLLEWVGNCSWNLIAGIDWKNRLDIGQQANLTVEIKQMILQCFGVVQILSFEAVFNSATRFDIINTTIQTIYSPSAAIVITPPTIGQL